MQSYNNTSKEEQFGKKFLAEYLDFIKYKVENDKLTVDEYRSLINFLSSGISLQGTAEDFAGYYGTSEVNVRSVLHRNLMPKPKRAVLYDFRKFNMIRPRRWGKKELLSKD